MPLYGTLIICVGILGLTIFILSKRISPGQARRRVNTLPQQQSTQQQQPQQVPTPLKQKLDRWGWLQKLPVGKVILTVVIMCTALVGYYFWTKSNKEVRQLTTVATPATNIPLEAVLQAIAECESGGQQLKDDVVVRNTNGTGDPSDDDIGKWQINLKHQAKLINELGADVYTEEGNRLVATELLKRSGTGPWSKTQKCWGPKLIAKGYSPDGKYAKLPQVEILEGPVFGWSTPFNTKPGFDFTTDWVDLETKPRHQIEYKTTEGVIVKTYPSGSGKKEEIPGAVLGFRVKSLEDVPVKIKITLTPI